MWNVTFDSSIDPRTLDEDLNCRKVESRLLTETEKIEELLNSMKLRKEALENERFEIFRVSTRKVRPLFLSLLCLFHIHFAYLFNYLDSIPCKRN